MVDREWVAKNIIWRASVQPANQNALVQYGYIPLSAMPSTPNIELWVKENYIAPHWVAPEDEGEQWWFMPAQPATGLSTCMVISGLEIYQSELSADVLMEAKRDNAISSMWLLVDDIQNYKGKTKQELQDQAEAFKAIEESKPWATPPIESA